MLEYVYLFGPCVCVCCVVLCCAVLCGVCVCVRARTRVLCVCTCMCVCVCVCVCVLCARVCCVRACVCERVIFDIVSLDLIVSLRRKTWWEPAYAAVFVLNYGVVCLLCTCVPPLWAFRERYGWFIHLGHCPSWTGAGGWPTNSQYVL